MWILAFWLTLGSFVGGFLQIMIASCDDKLSFKTAFWYVSIFYENNKDRLNSAGLTIAIVAISLLLLPGYILIFSVVCLHKVFDKLWKVYKYIFRKNRSKAAK